MVSLETHQETFDAFENNHNDSDYSHVLNTELFRQDFKIKTSLKVANNTEKQSACGYLLTLDAPFK